MDEQKEEKQEKKEEVSVEKPTSQAITREEIEERKKLVEDEKQLIADEEELAERRKVGGDSEAGIQTHKETEDEKWEKGVAERYEGTGMSPLPDKTEQ